MYDHKISCGLFRLSVSKVMRYSRAIPLPVDSYVVVDDELPEAVDYIPHGVVDRSAVQHHHIQWDVASEEKDLISELLVHVNTG